MAPLPTDDKQEPVPVDEAAIIPEPPVEGEVEVPYSIYTSKEKWIIVAMVALAGFYRSVNNYHQLHLLLEFKSRKLTTQIALCLRISTSQLSPHSLAPLASR